MAKRSISTPHRVLNAVNRFLALEASSGLLLMAAAAIALILCNVGLQGYYQQILDLRVSVAIGDLAIAKPLLLWINDGLMAIFFLLVGLEIKRELVEGELSDWKQASLPVIAAIGGMAVPALIFVMVNRDDMAALKGWAVPSATDIAFALAILGLLGPRVPRSLKIFLAALAIIDDLGAIVIIALFYTASLSVNALLAAVGMTMILGLLNFYNVRRIAPYIIAGILLWIFTLKSGVHATLAGVVTALFVPISTRKGFRPAQRLEAGLHPWVAYLILPLFGFANAGISFPDNLVESLAQPVPLGIILGLFVGKQIGVFGASWLAVKTKLARKPHDISWHMIYGVAILAGIGFTMSLFIGTLAWESAYSTELRIGVLGGSLLSGLIGYGVLSLFVPRQTIMR